jgi:hypothetical protein
MRTRYANVGAAIDVHQCGDPQSERDMDVPVTRTVGRFGGRAAKLANSSPPIPANHEEAET